MAADATVMICGAGPTGLALALELARFGIPLRIIDRDAAPATETRAIAVQARTLELLEPARLTDRILAAARRVRHVVLSSGGRSLFDADFEGMPTAYSWLTMVAQSDLERIMVERLGELGVSVERNVTLTEVRSDDGSARVSVLHESGATEHVAVRFLAACDGAHSTVRHLLNTPFGGRALPEHFQLADIDLDTDLSPDAARIALASDGGVVALFPLHDGWRVMVESHRDLAAAPDAATFQTALDAEHVPARITNVRWMSTYRIQQRRALTPRLGPVFLLGDAAHIHSPIGGQGMNSGIGDAVNLGWKLALTIRDGAPDRLLDSFAVERGTVARALLEATDYGNRVAFNANTMVRALRNAIIPVAARSALVRQRLRENVAQLRIAYPASPLSVNGAPARRGLRAGMRVRGARPSGYRPQTIVMHPHDRAAAMTIVLRPDGYAGYVADGAHAHGARTYLRNVIGLS